MKKIISLALAGTIAAAASLTAFAIDYPGGNQDTEITTSVAPTFTVSIPADTSVDFNDTSTSFGSVKLDSARLDPNKAVQVTIESDGELNNSADNGSVIPYTLTAAKGSDTTEVTAGYSAKFTAPGDKIDLAINITQEAWDAADAGDYSDVVSFTIAYVDSQA